MADETRDVVVIGGGILGLSVAYHLVADGVRDTVVLEKEEFLGTGATSAAAGGIRALFSTEVNVRLSLYSMDFYGALAERFGVAFDYVRPGYLFLTADGSRFEALQENVAFLRGLGVDAVLLGRDTIASRWPHLETEGLLGGMYHAKDGYATPNDALMGLAKGVRERGGEIRTRSCVTGFEIQDGRIRCVQTATGRIEARHVVNCAGPRLAAVAALARVELPALPIRRMLLLTSPLPEIAHPIPLTADVDTGFYCRTQTGGLTLGLSNKDEPPGLNRTVDWDWAQVIVEKGLQRVPCLAHAEIEDAWADCYTVTPDHHPILGPIPDLGNFHICGGFSGHGFMHAPAAGRIIADIIQHGESRTLDAHPLRFGRFAEGDLVIEQNVL